VVIALAKLVRVIFYQQRHLFDGSPEVSAILQLINESEHKITFKMLSNDDLFSAYIVKKEIHAEDFDSYYVSDVILLKGGK
jgi:hypothetical protein